MFSHPLLQGGSYSVINCLSTLLRTASENPSVGKKLIKRLSLEPAFMSRHHCSMLAFLQSREFMQYYISQTHGLGHTAMTFYTLARLRIFQNVVFQGIITGIGVGS